MLINGLKILQEYTVLGNGMTELSHCPFCGGHNLVLLHNVEYYIACMDCYAMGPDAPSLDVAFNLWNTRRG